MKDVYQLSKDAKKLWRKLKGSYVLEKRLYPPIDDEIIELFVEYALDAQRGEPRG